MTASIKYDEGREAHLIEGMQDADRYRLIVPRELLDDELGSDASSAERDAWVNDNLPQILSAYTARHGGGWVKSPWNRILVEELK